MDGAEMDGAMARRMPRSRVARERQSGSRGSRSRRVSVAQVGATVLFLALGSAGSFLLGVEVAARPISTLVGSANGASDSNNLPAFQADGSLGLATTSARHSRNHVKVGGAGGKNVHGQSGQQTGSQGQSSGSSDSGSSGQTPPPPAPGTGSGDGTGTGASSNPPVDGASPGTGTPSGSGDGSTPGSTSGAAGSAPGAGAPDTSGA